MVVNVCCYSLVDESFEADMELKLLPTVIRGEFGSGLS